MMGNSLAIWFLLVAGVVAANLPFFTDRVFGVIGAPAKSLGVRLLELLAFYFVVGGLGLFLENTGGQIAAQGWEFYAVTGALFLTLAFPGFVYRYLLKRHG